MQRIIEINLRNFRAFSDEKETVIKLPHGENLLVYGENGSGKSSLYAALLAFLESSNNETYPFTANRYAKKNSALNEDVVPGYVRVRFADAPVQVGNPSKTYQFGPAPLGANMYTSYRVNHLQKANQTRAFLSYQEIVRTYLAADNDTKAGREQETIKARELFRLLVETLLAHHKLPGANRTVAEELPELRYNLSRRAGSKQYNNAVARLGNPTDSKSFEQDLFQLLKPIFVELNRYLANYFDRHLQLDFRILARLDASNRIIQSELHLELAFGGHEPVPDYASFLNEARLSALAVCFYLAAIRANPQPEDFRILFLDDVFIGLDTNNRVPLLDLLKAEFVNPKSTLEEYQLFITTYDREWFDLAGRELGKNKWRHIELYAEEVKTTQVTSSNPPITEVLYHFIPAVVITEDYFDSAIAFRKCHNYPMAGNCLRKELERLMEYLLPSELRFNFDTEKFLPLEKQLNAFEKFYNRYSLLDSDFLERIKLFRNLVLNPASHHDIRRFLYRVEVDKTFDLVEKLRRLDKVVERVILQTGTELIYRGRNYLAKLRLTENFIAGKIDGKPPILADSNHQITFWRHNSVDFAGKNGAKLDQSHIDNHCSESKSCSFRAQQIAHYLGLKADEVSWKTDFLTKDDKSLVDLASDFAW